MVAAFEVAPPHPHHDRPTASRTCSLVSWPGSPLLLSGEPEEPCSCRGEQPRGGERGVHLSGRGGSAGRQRAPDRGPLPLRGLSGGSRAAAGLVQGPPPLLGHPAPRSGAVRRRHRPSARILTHSSPTASLFVPPGVNFNAFGLRLVASRTVAAAGRCMRFTGAVGRLPGDIVRRALGGAGVVTADQRGAMGRSPRLLGLAAPGCNPPPPPPPSSLNIFSLRHAAHEHALRSLMKSYIAGVASWHARCW